MLYRAVRSIPPKLYQAHSKYIIVSVILDNICSLFVLSVRFIIVTNAGVVKSEIGVFCALR